jgi:hypothetical protein
VRSFASLAPHAKWLVEHLKKGFGLATSYTSADPVVLDFRSIAAGVTAPRSRPIT